MKELINVINLNENNSQSLILRMCAYMDAIFPDDMKGVFYIPIGLYSMTYQP